MSILIEDANGSTILTGSASLDDYITTLHPEGSLNDRRYGRARELVRPNPHYGRAALHALAPVVVAAVVSLFHTHLAIAFLILYALARARAALIWLVIVYQRHASSARRMACLFEPSCSEYMIQCLRKYGLVIGCVKGVMRLARCRYPNGGDDYP